MAIMISMVTRDVTHLVVLIIGTAMLACQLVLCVPLHEGSLKNDWDHLVYAQQWGPTFCKLKMNLGKTQRCGIPRVVGTKTWLIHGLWPSKIGGQAPTCCNDSSYLDTHQIKDLYPKLKRYWPNLFLDSEPNWLLNHEWRKHGTCGVTLEAIDTQEKYFSVGLILSRDLNIYNALARQHILPSDDQSYDYNDIANALTDAFDIDFTPWMACFNDKKSQKNYLLQIYFCLTKDFELRTCDGTSFNPVYSCDPDLPILIPPVVIDTDPSHFTPSHSTDVCKKW